MAKFGITGLVTKDGRILTRGTNWITNTRFNSSPSGQLTEAGEMSVNEFFSQSTDIGLIEITGFNSNDQFASLNDLYQVPSAYAIISGDKFLLVTGSKKAKEFKAAGHDVKGASTVPALVVLDKKKKFKGINIVP